MLRGRLGRGWGRWWVGRLGLLLILALFSMPSAFPLSRASFHGGAGRFCLLLAGIAGCGGGGLSGGFPRRFSWSASLGAASRRRTLPPGRVGPLAATVWRWFEVGAKAWTTTSVDVVPFLKASFPTSSPTVLDVAGENLPWRATMSALLASFPPWGVARHSYFRD